MESIEEEWEAQGWLPGSTASGPHPAEAPLEAEPCALEDLVGQWEAAQRQLQKDLREQSRIWRTLLQRSQLGPMAPMPSHAGSKLDRTDTGSGPGAKLDYAHTSLSVAPTMTTGSEQAILRMVHGDLKMGRGQDEVSAPPQGAPPQQQQQAGGRPEHEPVRWSTGTDLSQASFGMNRGDDLAGAGSEAPAALPSTASPEGWEDGEDGEPQDQEEEKPLAELISRLHKKRNSIQQGWGGGGGNRHEHSVSAYVYGKKQELGLRGWLLKMMYTLADWWVNLAEPLRTGPLARVVTHPAFESVTMCVVIINCIFIIHQNNVNIRNLGQSEALPEYFKYVDVAFAAYFLAELLLRLMVHRLYFFINDDMNWNTLDFVIVVISISQCFQSFLEDTLPQNFTFLRAFRVLKLCRVLRLLRMIKVFTDLRVMVTAFLNSCLALLWCMLLLFFTIALFALVLVQVIGDYMVDNLEGLQACDGATAADPCLLERLMQNFGSVQRSMLSLYMATTGGNDWAFYYDMVSETSWVAGALFVFYTAFYYFGVFNLVTGMFVDKAVRASQPDADMLVFEQRHLEREFTNGFLAIFSDFDHDGQVDKEEFQKVINSDQGRIYLGMLGLEPKDSKIVFDSLAEVTSKVPVPDFVRGCMRMRGGATSLDVSAMQFELKVIHHNVILMHQAVAELRKSVRVVRRNSQVAARQRSPARAATRAMTLQQGASPRAGANGTRDPESDEMVAL